MRVDFFVCGFFFLFIYISFCHLMQTAERIHKHTKSVFDINEMAQWTILSRIFHVDGDGSSNRSTSVATVWVVFVKWDCSSFISRFFRFSSLSSCLFVCLLSCSQAFVYFIIVSIFECIFSIPKQVRSQTNARTHKHTIPFLEDTLKPGFWFLFVDDLQNKLTKNEHFVLVWIPFSICNMLCYVV